MPLSVSGLEAAVHAAKAADSPEEALASLGEALQTLASRSDLDASFLRGSSTSHGRDYSGALAASKLLLLRPEGQAPTLIWRELSEAFRGGVLRALPRRPPQASGGNTTPPPKSPDPGEEKPPGVQSSAIAPERHVDGEGESGEAEPKLQPWCEGSEPEAAGVLLAGELASQADTSGSDPPGPSGSSISSVEGGGPAAVAPAVSADGSVESGSAESSPAVARAEGDAEQSPDEDGASICWIAALLAMMLPLMSDTLPRDQGGVCIIPHPHEMEEQEATIFAVYAASGARPIFKTNKICDNCGSRITDRFFYHCSANCDIDFCQECQRRSESLLGKFMQDAGDADRNAMHHRLFWVIDVTERIGFYVLRQSAAERTRLARELAFEWPAPMFECLVQAAVDVLNAKVVHVQDVKDIGSDARFWYAVGWLQFLYAANALPCGERRLGEQATRGPKVDYERFILEGINKCEPVSEFQRWRRHPSAKAPDVLSTEWVLLTADFCSFLTHGNLVPVNFWRVCLLCDVWERIQAQQVQVGRIQPLQLEVPREPKVLLEKIVSCFRDLGEDELRRPLRVTFEGEEAVGPGVTKEFFQVALRSFLDISGAEECGEGEGEDGKQASATLFRCSGAQRTYWFDDESRSREDLAAAFRACGILLGQAVLNNVLVPSIFPRVLYERLLRDLGSPCARTLWIEDVASVSDEIAGSLQLVLDYRGEDIDEVYGEDTMGWSRTGVIEESASLSQSNKAGFVQAYVDWFLGERVNTQLSELSGGFCAILGESCLLRSMVDSVQLEKIVTGGTVPVDVEAIERGASLEGWSTEELSDYVPMFWEVLAGFSEWEKAQFVIFVTASERVPLRGWQDLGLIVQKLDVSEYRLPTAHTCFSQLLLPRYPTREVLRKSLLSAAANSEGFGLR